MMNDEATIAMSDYSIRIERLANGFTVETKDPDIVKANEAPNRKSGTYKDPYVKYAFSTPAEVHKFIKDHMERCLPVVKDEFTDSFNKAAKAKT